MGFYTNVSIIFLLLLIIILTIFYMLLRSKNTTSTLKNDSCPDYWRMNNDGYCVVPTAITELNGTNVYGNIIQTGTKTGTNTYNGIPYSAIKGTGNNEVNFNDASWTSYYNSNSLPCAWQSWARKNNVEWSGITNVSIPNC